MFEMPKLATRTLVVVLAAAVLLVLTSVLVYRHWVSQKSVETKLEISKGQTGAALESGRDAVDTVGNQMASERSVDQVTRENEDEIRSAEGADAPVAAPVRDAGLAGLCRRAAYSHDPRCVQRTPAP